MRRCFCGTSLEGRHPNARVCGRACEETARLAAVDEPCDPRELGPATVPGLSDSERRLRLVRQYQHADWRPHEIATILDMHPDSVSRIQKRDARANAGILKAEEA